MRYFLLTPFQQSPVAVSWNGLRGERERRSTNRTVARIIRRREKRRERKEKVRVRERERMFVCVCVFSAKYARVCVCVRYLERTNKRVEYIGLFFIFLSKYEACLILLHVITTFTPKRHRLLSFHRIRRTENRHFRRTARIKTVYEAIQPLFDTFYFLFPSTSEFVEVASNRRVV